MARSPQHTDCWVDWTRTETETGRDSTMGPGCRQPGSVDRSCVPQDAKYLPSLLRHMAQAWLFQRNCSWGSHVLQLAPSGALPHTHASCCFGGRGAGTQ